MYKRQDFYAAQCGGIRFDYDLLAGNVTVYDYHAEPLQQKTVTDFAPVSYTHLDVYKRQARC